MHLVIKLNSETHKAGIKLLDKDICIRQKKIKNFFLLSD